MLISVIVKIIFLGTNECHLQNGEDLHEDRRHVRFRHGPQVHHPWTCARGKILTLKQPNGLCHSYA